MVLAQAQELQPLVSQFNALLVRLDNAYQQLEGFNADVAHELRTPLATLIGETELALSRSAVSRKRGTFWDRTSRTCTASAGLVNDMLFLSKADRGEQARRSPVSLAALAAEVVEFHDAALQEAGVSVRVCGDGAARSMRVVAAGGIEPPRQRNAVCGTQINDRSGHQARQIWRRSACPSATSGRRFLSSICRACSTASIEQTGRANMGTLITGLIGNRGGDRSHAWRVIPLCDRLPARQRSVSVYRPCPISAWSTTRQICAYAVRQGTLLAERLNRRARHGSVGAEHAAITRSCPNTTWQYSHS